MNMHVSFGDADTDSGLEFGFGNDFPNLYSNSVFGIHLWDYDLKLVCCEYKFCKTSRCISKKFHRKGKHKTKHKLYKKMYLQGG